MGAEGAHQLRFDTVAEGAVGRLGQGVRRLCSPVFSAEGAAERARLPITTGPARIGLSVSTEA
ncbi:MAG: hypothetical protein R3253_01590 [Longimicrobiales bacterium]|nr:hypothetical protein [Longimicrobiales bacterium]